MLLVIDNYDSFTYNLVQYLGEMGESITVRRNDEISIGEIEAMEPERIVISPGPGSPADAGISNDVISQLGPAVPILGVCLGHQCIGEVFGGRVERAPRLMHGKTSQIYHYGDALFTGLPSPFEATRYHSLIVCEPLPDTLKIIAFTKDGEVMGIQHREYPIYGVQFHPESILTSEGKKILKNFLRITAVHPQVASVKLAPVGTHADK
ncbi:MAG TPA: aminodeoxychorismate/anthranilate synthase component II [Anaerolineales bacterium]|nr:aminodeoxychorismate/anthranilate synthase component II [Anaerolineales bacterium]